jgi:phosphopantothenoylcysteine decarboxylase/phosphopantothenate--cysteine ligase
MDLSNIECIRVQDSEEMYAQTIKHFKESDIVIFSAAISDFKPIKTNSSKIKKEFGLNSIDLQPTLDILKELGKIKTSQFLVGFALETENVIENAKSKLKSKNLDAIVVNKIGDFNPISSDYNQIDFINSNLEVTSFKKKLKIDVSNDIISQIIENVKKT